MAKKKVKSKSKRSSTKTSYVIVALLSLILSLIVYVIFLRPSNKFDSEDNTILISTKKAKKEHVLPVLKDIIEPITNAVDKVKNLRTVIGKFKNDESGKRRPFLMAQDFLNSLPEVVDVSDPEAFGLMYSETIVLAFAAIKELAERIEILEAKG